MAYKQDNSLMSQEYSVLGTRPIRHDGVDKVTGRAQYGADISMPRMLYGKILRSPFAHARIKSIDTGMAEKHPGIMAVVTSRDFPDNVTDQSLKFLRDNIMASDKVLYKGHPVAGVVAANPHVAEEALSLIKVEYELLEPVLTAPEAMKNEAPLLHSDLPQRALGQYARETSNIAAHFQHILGDIEDGFSKSDLVIEREFRTKTVHQGYIEPHNATAFWSQDGKVTIWCSTQGPFEVRDASAQILGLNVSDVTVIPMEIGGGFGGKFEPYGDPVAALLSKKTGHPVKIVMTRSEDLESTGPTPGSHIRVKMGVTNQGKILAAQAYLSYEAGAYPGSPVDAGAECIFAAYAIPNVLIDGFDVLVNKPKTAAYRAPGATNAAFACETVLDELAEKISMSPIEIRLMNAASEGTRRSDGLIYPRIGCVEVIAAMKNHPHLNTPIEGPNRGRGIAIGYWMNGGGPASCTIKVNADGTVNLNEGSPDIGGSRTSVAMQAAEVLGIPVEDVKPSVMDTDSIGYTSGTGGSSVTFKTGRAAYDAARDVKYQMIKRLARIWDVHPDSILFENGLFRWGVDHASNPELNMTFRELAGKLDDLEGPVVGSATSSGTGAGGAFAGCIVDVEVDPETGKVEILRFTIAQDVGKAIHPSYVEGQMQGGSVQGIGWALNEEYFMGEAGEMLNASFLDYRMPTSLDLPMIDTAIVEVPNPRHPFGVRGVGEVSIVPPPPAIANAIYSALGIRIYDLPMNPSTVMEAIWGQTSVTT